MTLTRLIVIIAVVLCIIYLALVVSARAEGLKEGQYIVGPGTSVMIGKPPAGVKLDDIGCAYLNATTYKCYAGMHAGQQFTSRQEMLVAWRAIMNPTSMLSANQIREGIKAGRGYQMGVR